MPRWLARKLRTLLDDFETHQERMRYAEFKRRGVPRSSGVVESAVRRIVNLRLKGNGVFWLLENAEGMLHLRSQVLSGRWGEFIRVILSTERSWGTPMAVDSGFQEAA